MKKVYNEPVAETIIVADNFLTAQSVQPPYIIDMDIELEVEDEGFAE